MLAYNFTTDCLTYNPNFDIEIHNYKFMCIQWINYVLNWLYSCDFGWGWVYPVQAVGTWHQGPDNGGGSAATGVPRKCAHTDLLLTGWVSPLFNVKIFIISMTICTVSNIPCTLRRRRSDFCSCQAGDDPYSWKNRNIPGSPWHTWNSDST